MESFWLNGLTGSITNVQARLDTMGGSMAIGMVIQASPQEQFAGLLNRAEKCPKGSIRLRAICFFQAALGSGTSPAICTSRANQAFRRPQFHREKVRGRQRIPMLFQELLSSHSLLPLWRRLHARLPQYGSPAHFVTEIGHRFLNPDYPGERFPSAVSR
jgi:hypothetical protein